MKPWALSKLLIDLGITAAMLLLMTYALVGESLHEWLGVGMFVLFIVHHLLNASWHKNLARGRYNGPRTVSLVLDSLIFLCMLGLMWSSLMLSRYVFSFLGLSGSLVLARALHMLCSYWGFVLMSVHLGLHWRGVMSILKMRARTAPAWAWILRAAALALSAFGAYIFFGSGMPAYLFLRTQFVFIDYSKPLFINVAEYLSVMVLFACLAYYGAAAFRKKTRKEK